MKFNNFDWTFNWHFALRRPLVTHIWCILGLLLVSISPRKLKFTQIHFQFCIATRIIKDTIIKPYIVTSIKLCRIVWALVLCCEISTPSEYSFGLSPWVITTWNPAYLEALTLAILPGIINVEFFVKFLRQKTLIFSQQTLSPEIWSPNPKSPGQTLRVVTLIMYRRPLHYYNIIRKSQ